MNAPSLRVTWVHTIGDMKTSTTQYICGRNKRIERRSCSGRADTTLPTKLRYEYGPLRAAIFNRDLGYSFEVEPASRVYTAIRANEFGSPIWSKPQRLAETKPSGKTRDCHIDTIDTGERREMFGYIARHVVTKSRQSRDSELLGESEVDAWYIDPPAAWRSLHPPLRPGVFTYLSASSAENDDYKFNEAGRQETGFVLLATRKLMSSFRDKTGALKVHESVQREEVTEFSEVPLEPDLFVPPLDFKQVPQLPGAPEQAFAYRTRLRWELLKDSIRLPNQIARFTRAEMH